MGATTVYPGPATIFQYGQADGTPELLCRDILAPRSPYADTALVYNTAPTYPTAPPPPRVVSQTTAYALGATFSWFSSLPALPDWPDRSSGPSVELLAASAQLTDFPLHLAARGAPPKLTPSSHVCMYRGRKSRE